MNFINDINEETIIIGNEGIRKYILELNILKPIKFMTMAEFLKMFYYTYDESAILFVMHEYNLKYEIAQEYIENTYYVTDKSYGFAKLDFLVDLKRKLMDNDLLINNDYFRSYAKRVKIIIYDAILDDYTLALFKSLDYKIINANDEKHTHTVLEFATAEDEVRYVAREIAKLIDEGIDINRIKLTNVGREYHSLLSRIFSLYGIPVSINYKSVLASYDVVDTFIARYQRGEEIATILDDIKTDNYIYAELVKVINKYLKYDNQELLIYKLNHSYITNKMYVRAVEIVNYLDYVSSDNEYVFMLGFNEGIIPQIKLDTAYITDNLAEVVGISPTSKINEIVRQKTLQKINAIKNLVITYKNSDCSGKYYPSNLIDNFNVFKGELDYKTTYSAADDMLQLVKAYDNYFKYGENNSQLAILHNNYSLKYHSYNNQFTGIVNDNAKLSLSYSKMNVYNKCAFRYYLANVLKLDFFSENFSTLMGKMVHYVMEECLGTKVIDIDKYVSDYVKDYKLNKKEEFFLNKYKVGLTKLIEQIKLEEIYSSLHDLMLEEKIEFDVDELTHFTGIIDKLMYAFKDNKTYVALVDYKTGDEDISLSYLNEGINIQLPIYLYLASKLDFDNIVYVGFYLQKFKLVDADYRLEGYSNSDPEILQMIDKNYENSKIIKSLKTNKDGSFLRYSKIISNSEIDELLQIVDRQIRTVAGKIRNNEFLINPKVTSDKNIGCAYCQFKDICFKTKNDEVFIQESSLGE